MAQTENIEKQRLINFMRHTSMEVTPKGVQQIGDLNAFLRPGSTVYVTALPGSDFSDTINAARYLNASGFKSVPHFSARAIKSKKQLEEDLDILTGEIGIKEGLLVGGGSDTVIGEFASSIEVLRTGLFEKYGFKKLGLAGHPEGCPDVSLEDCLLAIDDKNAYAKNTDMDLYLATQFVFEARPVLDWERAIRERGNVLPIHVGIPGIATIKTLLRHAEHCGVGPSVRFLKRNPANVIRLALADTFFGRFVNAPSSNPSELIRNLVRGIYSDSGCLIERCHLYPLGGLAKSAIWLDSVRVGDFSLNQRGFDLYPIAGKKPQA